MYQPGPLLTASHAREVLEAGMRAIESGQTVFDLAAVTEVDSTAVAALLAWQRAARARGAQFSALNQPSSLTSLAHLYGVADLIQT
jgi:phospholipid transport system transporter-binding protein